MKYFSITFLSLLLSGWLVAAPKADSLDVRIDPEYVSPNDDGVKDGAFFYPVLRAGSEVQQWRLEVKTHGGSRVHRQEGNGPTALIKWDLIGKKDLPIKEGVYSVTLM